jgi:hypothetical protein
LQKVNYAGDEKISLGKRHNLFSLQLIQELFYQSDKFCLQN